MKTLTVVVDELPENCNDCFYYNIHYCGKARRTYCYALPSLEEEIQNEYIRPDFCPLVIEEVCEWKGKHRRIGKPDEHFEYKSPHEEPHYHTDFPNAVNGGVYDTKIYTYCHVCGKRIKYVESEE